MEWFKKVMKRTFNSYEYRVLMIGLDAAGKTTMLYRLKFNESMVKVYLMYEFISFKVYIDLFYRHQYQHWG